MRTAIAKKAAKGKAAAVNKGKRGRGPKLRLKPLDLPAILLPLAALAWLALSVYSPGGEADSVTISSDTGKWIYALDQDRLVRVPGFLGESLVLIEGGKALVQESPCPNQLCVHQGAVSEAGQWIACLPNHVLVRIGGPEAEDGIDAESR